MHILSDAKLGVDERSLSDERKYVRISYYVRENHSIYSALR